MKTNQKTKLKTEQWSTDEDNMISASKRLMAHLSIKVRSQQFQHFLKKMKPARTATVLDVGVTPDEVLADSNFFETVFPFSKNLTIASVENCKKLVRQYHLKKFVMINPQKQYPFKKKAFDIVTAWATLEHVGGKKEQRRFLAELERVGKKVFVTTPYKFSPYELHTELLFLHWLPDHIFRSLLRLMGKNFWSKEENLRLLSRHDAQEIIPNKDYQIDIFWSFGFLPTHLLIYKT